MERLYLLGIFELSMAFQDLEPMVSEAVFLMLFSDNAQNSYEIKYYSKNESFVFALQ